MQLRKAQLSHWSDNKSDFTGRSQLEWLSRSAARFENEMERKNEELERKSSFCNFDKIDCRKEDKLSQMEEGKAV